MASLEELRDHARRTYRYWPIYLVLRLREIEQHLDPDNRPALLGSGSDTAAPDVSGLVQAGLWRGAVPASTPSPSPLPLPDGATLCFEVQQTVDAATLVAVAQNSIVIHQLDIMRVPSAHAAVLHRAVDHFNQLAVNDLAGALDTARLWATLHGARALDWQQVSVSRTTPTAASPPLPSRRRGKGQFRTPY
jgi:hypothetical protein